MQRAIFKNEIEELPVFIDQKGICIAWIFVKLDNY